MIGKDAEIIALASVLSAKCEGATIMEGSCGRWATTRYDGICGQMLCDECVAYAKREKFFGHDLAHYWTELRQAKRARRFEALLTGEV